MNERPRHYPSDTSDEQWAIIEPLLPPMRTGGRPEKHSRRAIVDAILYVVRAGCSWRQLPADFPPWQTVYWYFNQWEQAKATEKILPVVRAQLRVQEGRNPEPSAGLIDSQSVKGADTVGATPAATTPGRKSTDGNGSSSPTPWACCWSRPSWPPRPRTATAPSRCCWTPTCAPGCGSSSPTAGSPVGSRADPGLANRAPSTGARLRTRPDDLRGNDPLGGDQHHHPSHRPRQARDSPTTTPSPTRQMIFSNTL